MGRRGSGEQGSRGSATSCSSGRGLPSNRRRSVAGERPREYCRGAAKLPDSLSPCTRRRNDVTIAPRHCILVHPQETQPPRPGFQGAPNGSDVITRHVISALHARDSRPPRRPPPAVYAETWSPCDAQPPICVEESTVLTLKSSVRGAATRRRGAARPALGSAAVPAQHAEGGEYALLLQLFGV